MINMQQPLPTTTPQPVLLTRQNKRTLLDWHIALNHLNFASLKKLSTMVDGMEISNPTEILDCEACHMGKAKQRSFTPTSNTPTRKGELISSDVWHSPTPTSEGLRYYILFTDHFSKYRWIYFMKSRAEIPDIVIQFLTRAENF